MYGIYITYDYSAKPWFVQFMEEEKRINNVYNYITKGQLHWPRHNIYGCLQAHVLVTILLTAPGQYSIFWPVTWPIQQFIN